MTFIETVPEDEATGATAEVYANDRDAYGFLPNFTRGFHSGQPCTSPGVSLNDAIKNEMDLRRYELATVAAARRLRSSYCALAHGSVLNNKFLEPDALRALVADNRTADLEDTDVAVMDLADKVVEDATAIEQVDIDVLRLLGLSDAEIFAVRVGGRRTMLLQQGAGRARRPTGREVRRSRSSASSGAHRRRPIAER